MLKPVDQIAPEHNSGLIKSENDPQDTLAFWCEAYFTLAVMTTEPPDGFYAEPPFLI